MSKQPTEAYNHGYDDAERGHPFDGGPYAGDDAKLYRDGYNAAKLHEGDPS